MTTGARVRSLQALDEWKSSLRRFVQDTEVALESAELEVRCVEDWLQQRLSYWNREVEQAREEVRDARAALQECRSEDDNYCQAEEDELQEAKHHLSNAEAELENARRWTHQVQYAAQKYRTRASHLKVLLSTDMGRADAILDGKINDLRRYLAVSAPAAEATASPVAGDTEHPQTIETWAVQGQGVDQQALHDALSTLATAKSGAAIAKSIRSKGTRVSFGRTLLESETGKPPLARYFPPPRNEIVISEGLKGSSQNVLAAHLAHEGTHAHWWPRRNSLNQEYHAFMAEARVWIEVRGNEKDWVCDLVVEKFYNKSEAEAKRSIDQLYQSRGIYLPEDA